MGTIGLRWFMAIFLAAQVVAGLTFGLLIPIDWLQSLGLNTHDHWFALVLGLCFAQAIIAATLIAIVRLTWLPRMMTGLCLIALTVIVMVGYPARLDQRFDATLSLVITGSMIALSVALVAILGAVSWIWKLQVVYGEVASSSTKAHQYGLWQLLASITAVAVLLGIGRGVAEALDLTSLDGAPSASYLVITFAIVICFAAITGLLTLIGWLAPRYLFVMVPLTLLLTLGISLLEWSAIEMARENGSGPSDNDGIFVMLLLNGAQYGWLSLSLFSVRLVGFRLISGSSSAVSLGNSPEM